jgi:hypothetical protein
MRRRTFNAGLSAASASAPRLGAGARTPPGHVAAQAGAVAGLRADEVIE